MDSWVRVQTEVFVRYYTAGFLKSDRIEQQAVNNDTYYRPPVICRHCSTYTENDPDAGIHSGFE